MQPGDCKYDHKHRKFELIHSAEPIEPDQVQKFVDALTKEECEIHETVTVNGAEFERKE